MRKALKFFSYFLLGLLGLIILIFIILQIPITQFYLANKVADQFSRDLETRVETGKINISPTGRIIIRQLYIEDRNGDTLVYADKAAGNLHYWKMITGDLYLTNLLLQEGVANVYRGQQQEYFNYQFLIDYFAPADTTSSSGGLNFDLGSVKARDLKFSYIDRVTETKLLAGIEKAVVDFSTLGLETDKMIIDDIELSNSFVYFEQHPLQQELTATTVTPAQDPAAAPLQLSIHNISLSNVKFKYDDYSIDPVSEGIDFAHLDISNINTEIEDVMIDGANIAANIQNLTLQEKSGLTVTRFSTDFSLSDSKMEFRELLLTTPGTVIRNYFAMNYKSFDSFDNFPTEVKMYMDLAETTIRMKDLKLFVPFLDTLDYLQRNNVEQIQLSGEFSGSLSSFTADKLYVRIDEQNRFSGDVIAKNLMAPDKMELFIDADTLAVASALFRPIVPAGSLPNEVWDLNRIRFEGEVKVTPQQIVMDPVHAHFGNSYFYGSGIIANYNTPNNISFDVNIDEFVAKKDLLDVVKAMGIQLPGDLKNVNQAYVSGSAEGSMQRLQVQNLTVRLDNEHIFEGTGTVTNLQNFDNMSIDANIQQLKTTDDFIASLMPEANLPENWDEIGAITYTGNISGTMRNLTAQGTITSNLGTLKPNLTVNIPEEKYQGTITTENFDLSFLTPDTMGLGRVSLTANVQGQGFQLENMTTTGKLNVSSIQYKGYTYNNINLDGEINDQVISGELSIDDENLQLTFDGTMSLNEQLPVYQFNANIARANLAKLNITQDPLTIRAKMDFDFSGNSMDNITGTGVIYDLRMEDGQYVYQDSIIISSEIQNDTQTIEINSDAIYANIIGDYNIAELPTAFNNLLAEYLNIPAAESTVAENQAFTFKVVLKQQTAIPAIFIPGLQYIGPGRITGQFNSAKDLIEAEASIAEMKYNDILFNSITADINTGAEKINYTVSTSYIEFADSILLPNASVTGALKNQNLTFNLRIQEDTTKNDLQLAGVADFSGEYIDISLNPSDIVINSKNWSIPAGNEIIIGDQYLEVNNFILQHNDERITVTSAGTRANNNISITTSNLRLHDLTQIVNFKGYNFYGSINGTAEIRDIFTDPGFDIDATINRFVLNEDTLGNISVVANTPINSNRTNLRIDIFDSKQRANINGYITTLEDQTNLNLSAELNDFKLVLLEPLLTDIITEISGTATGNVQITQTLSSPGIKGSIYLQGAEMTPVLNQTHYTVQNTTINFNNERINLNDLVLKDPQGNILNVNGSIRHQQYQEFTLDIVARTDNFQFLNTTSEDNEFFYGTIFASGTIEMTGSLMDPNIYVNVATAEGSKLFLPTVEAGQTLNYDFIRFYPIAEENLEEIAGPAMGFDVEMNLEVKPNAEVVIIINPLTGERIRSIGEGNLFISTNELNEMRMFGTYIVREGNYHFALERDLGAFLNRDLTIQDGSTMTWSGDPANAKIDATAIYDVTTNTIPLAKSQGAANPESAPYNYRIPIDVMVYLDGELYKPQISFDIQMDREDASTYENEVAALIESVTSDPNQLNTQVFSLLLFNSFMQDFTTVPIGNTAGTTAYNTIGNFLASQLSEFASAKLGVNVDVSLEQYQTANSAANAGEVDMGPTRLNVALSKTFLNDRLNVTIGSKYDVSASGADLGVPAFLGDLILAYSITADGDFKAKLFHKSDYDIFKNQDRSSYYKTGAGLSYRIEFNKLFGTKEEEVKPKEEPVKEHQDEQPKKEEAEVRP